MDKNGIKSCSSCAVSSAKPDSLEPDAIMTNPAKEREEILSVGQECPFCHFTRLKREGNQIVCHICGYGRKIFT